MGRGNFEDVYLWVPTIRQKVRQLGRQFYVPPNDLSRINKNVGGIGSTRLLGDDLTFPLDFLTRELEQLWAQYRVNFATYSSSMTNSTSMTDGNGVDEEWILKTMLSAHVPYDVLFDVYRSLYRSPEHVLPSLTGTKGSTASAATGTLAWQMNMLLRLTGIVDLWQKDVSSSCDVGAPESATQLSLEERRVAFADACPRLIRAFDELLTDLQAMRDDTTQGNMTKSKALNAIRHTKDRLRHYREDYFG